MKNYAIDNCKAFFPALQTQIPKHRGEKEGKGREDGKTGRWEDGKKRRRGKG